MTQPQDIDSAHGTSSIHLGIDVGGTDVKLGLVDGNGAILAEDRTPTSGLGNPTAVFEFAHQFADQQMRAKNLAGVRLCGVGLAVPGVLDTQVSVIREVVNLQGWLGVPLKEELERVFELPSVVINDANSAAYAEHSLRGLGNHSLALVTLGTGVGCGMVIAGDPFGGDHGCAGELGHITIDFSDEALPCTCGSRGHLETYAGSGGVMNRMKSALKDGADSSGGSISVTEITSPREIAAGAEAGDAICKRVIADTASYVGRAIGLIGQTVDPAVVLLGGAMTFGGNERRVGREFLETVRQTVQQTTLVQVGENIKIEFATLGNQAGMIGAAMVARHQGIRDQELRQQGIRDRDLRDQATGPAAPGDRDSRESVVRDSVVTRE
ncbi:Glucokinase [Planctomycetes bacterium CA13]|uniref:Glucokinase n=1 Tax=Novipirellula herctigrandis TaxID=2527986 RepID=A0A5C5YVP7_9BACT|nr:Glucokinase [Planctomycetes bacterium CA13]